MSSLRRSIALTLSATLVASCQPNPGAGESPDDQRRPFEVYDGADAGEALVFPPAVTLNPRREAPRQVREEVERQTDVDWPRLDDDGAFAFSGTTLSISFSRPIVVPTDLETAITIDPPVAGKTTASEHGLTFLADAPFDPEQTYSLKLAPLTGTDGDPVAPDFHATFEARPLIPIAGKFIDYLPVKGQPQLVLIDHAGHHRVGRTPVVTAVFDQPLDLPALATSLAMEVDGVPVAPALSHPDADEYQGVHVDRKYLVQIAPPTRLSAGSIVKLTLDDALTDGEASPIEMDVAGPLALSKVLCGYGGDESCALSGGTLHSSDRSFTIKLNNAIDMKDKALARAISISPAVRNLSVYSDAWSDEGVIRVSGEFQHSKTYRVNVGRLRDRFGSTLRKTVAFDLVRPPQTTSAAMTEGVRFLDAAASKHFAIETRNVAAAKVSFWEVEPTTPGHQRARRHLSDRQTPRRVADVELDVRPRARRDRMVTTELNLLDSLAPGKTYLARLQVTKAAFSAPSPKYPSWSVAGRSPTALVTAHGDDAIVLHGHASGNKTIVHVARLATGEPIADATVRADGLAAAVRTDAHGVAVLGKAPRAGHPLAIVADADGQTGELVLGLRSLSGAHFAKGLGGTAPMGGKVRALLVTDRGAYRPGATVQIKAGLRTKASSTLTPLAEHPVRIRLVDPTGKDIIVRALHTDAMGSAVTSAPLGARAAIGRYRVVVENAEGTARFGEQTIQVAEFEPPRFTVDVEVEGKGKGALATAIVGKYLFGGRMADAPVQWTLRRHHARLPSGAMARRGLRFVPERSWYDEARDDTWVRTGSGALNSAGTLNLTQAVAMPEHAGPQRFEVEAEVSDASHRAITGRGSFVVHAAEHYAGIRVSKRWLAPKTPIPFEVGVVDQQGETVAGKKVEVVLTRRRWVKTRKSGPGKSIREQWHVVRDRVDSCTITSKTTVAHCPLATKAAGDHELSTFVDGKAGGTTHLYAWGSSGSRRPSKGRTLEIATDKPRYHAGDSVRLMVDNPLGEATAIVTLDDGGILMHRTETVRDPVVALDVELPPAAQGPWVHATVTLLPIGAAGDGRADFKVGAVRIPVSLHDATLSVQAKSDQDAYAPGETVHLDLDVTHGGAPAAGVDVALAVVDEGILRLTNHHAPDPVAAMHPGNPLSLIVDDNRRALADTLARSRVGGDGPGAGAQSLVGARKKFVRTALWKPDLRTDAEGHIDVDFTLPDNLTRFRVMVVALDEAGRGGSTEEGFNVRKPLMIQPAVPRFATLGDTFEAAVMVHNNTESAETATVSLDGRQKSIEVGPGRRARVGFAVRASSTGERSLVFAIKDGEGRLRDKVQAKLSVTAAGVDERPVLAGAFTGLQEITMRVPAGILTDPNADDVVTVSLGEQLWPELATRLGYLVDYPHGCVEQTTSSTVPLLAARKILPQMGVTKYTEAEIDDMIEHGLSRLDSMRTASGGLAYWPGGHEPNLYGTAYAMLAVAGAKHAGLTPPEGLLEGMQRYLESNLRLDAGASGERSEVVAAVALSLAHSDALPASIADALFEARTQQGPFGLAATAIALASLPGETQRVGEVLDTLLAQFDDNGNFNRDGDLYDFTYFGSATRTRALTAMALGRLRPDSTKLPGIVHRLLDDSDGYTTQSTAYALLALSEHIERQAEVAEHGRVRALIDGIPVSALLGEVNDLGGGAMQYEIPIERLAGHEVSLLLQSETDTPIRFSVAGRWRRPVADVKTRAATTGKRAPDLWRVVTDVEGNPVDLKDIRPGTTLRVVLLARMPRDRVERRRLGYLALTDRLPAGFEALQPDLWTVASVPELSDKHPLRWLIGWGSDASHVELRDASAHFYFDRTYGEYVHATYLMRATTPGTFVAPPAAAELMYETDGTGYTEPLTFKVMQ